MQDTHANVIAGASSGLQRAVIGLGAEVVALVEVAGSGVEVMYFWRRSGGYAPVRRSLQSNRLLADAVSGKTVVVAATAEILREVISEHSQSFLPLPLQGAQTVI